MVKWGAARGLHPECRQLQVHDKYLASSQPAKRGRYHVSAGQFTRRRQVDPARLRVYGDADNTGDVCLFCCESICRDLVNRGLPVLCERWTEDDERRERQGAIL